MKKGKFTKSKSAKRSGVKLVALVLVMALLIGGAIGGTLAWLTDTTKSVTNTFTASDIDITLQEHTYDATTDKLTTTPTPIGVDNYKMIPGWTIPKDPWVTVEANSEDCYLFVKVVKSSNFDTYMTYQIADGWTQGQGTGEGKNGIPTDVIYRVVSKSTDDQTFGILKDNKVNVKESVTKADMDAITNETKPKLTFTAYASQLMKNNSQEFTAAEAWANVNS